MKKIKVPIEVSARHVHLSHHDLDVLFGKGYKLQHLKQLSQPMEFATKEIVTIKTKLGELKARVLGPLREESQIEISKTEAVKLGLNPPVRESHDLKGTPGVTLIGPKGSIKLKEGVILAWRHIHASEKQAAKFGLKHGQVVSVLIPGPRSVVLNQVEIKVHIEFDWHMHIDTDEANAAGVEFGGTTGEIIIGK
jgi:putative phosphotransacetylase